MIEKTACLNCGAPPTPEHAVCIHQADRGLEFHHLCPTCNAKARALMAEFMLIVKSPWVHFRGFVDEKHLKD